MVVFSYFMCCVIFYINKIVVKIIVLIGLGKFWTLSNIDQQVWPKNIMVMCKTSRMDESIDTFRTVLLIFVLFVDVITK